ncbi:hypothetical protein ACOSP7_010678 [Xanthoceras sorbifolium]
MQATSPVKSHPGGSKTYVGGSYPPNIQKTVVTEELPLVDTDGRRSSLATNKPPIEMAEMTRDVSPAENRWGMAIQKLKEATNQEMPRDPRKISSNQNPVIVGIRDGQIALNADLNLAENQSLDIVKDLECDLSDSTRYPNLGKSRENISFNEVVSAPSETKVNGESDKLMGGLSYSENNLTVQVDPSLIRLASNNSMSVKGNGPDPMDSENHVVDELEAGPVFHFISEGGPKRRWKK